MADRSFQKPLLDREPDLEVIGAHDLFGVIVHRVGFAPLLGRQQFAGIGMLRVGKDRLGRAGLDDFAILHHADLVSDAANDAQVVGDEQQPHVLGALKFGQKVQDLRLDGDIERRCGFVRDQDVRLVGQRHGDHHPLPLPARKLVGIGAKPGFRVADTGPGQQLKDTAAGRVADQPLMQRQRFRQLPFDRVQRVERGHRLLKDEADVVAAHIAEQVVGGADHLPAVIGDGTFDHGRGGQQRHGGKRGHGLARAAFADQRHGFAAIDAKARPAHRRNGAPVLAERYRQVLHAQQAH